MSLVQSATAVSNYYQQGTSTSVVSVAAALSAFKINPLVKLDISDSAANVEKNIEGLRRVANNIKTLTFTDTSASLIHVKATQYLGGLTLFNKMSLGGANSMVSLSVSDVLSKDTSAFNANSKVSEFSVKDSSVNIALNVTALSAAATPPSPNSSKLGALQLTDPGTSIKITATQLNDNDALWSHMAGGYGFDVSAASTDQALAMKSNGKVRAVNILDNAAAIASHLDDLQDLGVQLKTVKSSDANLFSVDASQLQRDTAVLGKIYKGYQLAVFNVDASTALNLRTNKKVVTLDVVDTAQNVSKNLVLMDQLGSQLHSIRITDADSNLTMTSEDFMRHVSVLSKLVKADKSSDAGHKLEITNASAVDAATLLTDARVDKIYVADTSASIALNLDDLSLNTKVQSISQTGRATALNITAAQVSNALFAKFKENYSLNVSGVSASAAFGLVANNGHIASLSVTGDANAIQTNLAHLAALGKTLTSISQTDPSTSLSLTAGNWTSYLGALSKIVGGYGVELEGVSAAKALSMGSDAHVRAVKVSDTAAAISANLDALQGLAGKLTSITQSDYTAGADSPAIQITGQQYSANFTGAQTNPGTLTKLGTNYKLSVQKARADQIATLANNTAHVKDIQVVDTVNNMAANLSTLQTVLSRQALPDSDSDKLAMVPITMTMTGVPSAFTLTRAQLSQYDGALATISGSYAVKVTDALVSDVDTLNLNNHVLSIGVNASTNDLSDANKLATLRALGPKLSSLQQTTPISPLTLPVSVWNVNAALLDKVQGYRVALTGVTAASADVLMKNEHVQSLSIEDSSAEISRNFDKLSNLSPKIDSIQKNNTDNLKLSYSQWSTGSATLAKILPALSSGSQIDIQVATAEDAKVLFVNGGDAIASIAVTDSAENISAHLSDLMDNTKVQSIKLTGPSTPITLSMAQLTAASPKIKTWEKIQGAYGLAVTNAELENLTDLMANTHVVNAELKGSSISIASALPNLAAAGAKLKSLKLTDPSLSPNVTTMSLNYSDFQKYRSILGMIKEPFSLSLTDMTASAAAAVSQDTQFKISQLSVKDTAANIATNLDALHGLGAKLIALAATDPGAEAPIMSISGIQAIADADVLAKITPDANNRTYSLNVTQSDMAQAIQLLQNSHVQSINVTDTADNLSNQFDVLSDSHIASIRFTADSSELSISGAQFGAATTSTVLSKILGAYSLNVQAASVSQVTALQDNSHVTSYALSTSSAAINAQTLTSLQLPALLTKSKLDHIDITDDPASAPANVMMTLTNDQLTAVDDNLGKLNGSYWLNVTDVSLLKLDSIKGRSDVAGIGITDTLDAIATGWDQLTALGVALNKVDVVSTQGSTAPTTLGITQAQWADAASAHVLGLLPNTQNIELLDVSIGEAMGIKADPNSYPQVTGVYVKATASQIHDQFADLVSLGDFGKAVEVTDGGILDLTNDQWASPTGLKIMGNFEYPNLG